MADMIFTGRPISDGIVEAEAIVSRDPIVFNRGIDAETGIIVEKGHDLEGQSVEGKILVFPYGKGSTGGAWTIYRMGVNKKGPIGMICARSEVLTTVGAILGNIPVVDSLSDAQFTEIKTGQRLRIDGTKGTVEMLAANNG